MFSLVVHCELFCILASYEFPADNISGSATVDQRNGVKDLRIRALACYTVVPALQTVAISSYWSMCAWLSSLPVNVWIRLSLFPCYVGWWFLDFSFVVLRCLRSSVVPVSSQLLLVARSNLLRTPLFVLVPAYSCSGIRACAFCSTLKIPLWVPPYARTCRRLIVSA